MEKSFFKQWVAKYFQPIVSKFTELVNGEKKELTYLHKQMLRKTFSTDLKWASLSVFNSNIAADVVSQDSSLPLKKRDSIKQVEGEIPKLGMKMYLNESTLQDLDILESTNRNDVNKTQILAKLFQDAKKCTVGIWETLEFMFLQGLSTGVTSIEDENNTGTAVRIDYGHPDSNKFGVEKIWSDANAKPITDITHILDQAAKNGDKPSYMLMDRSTWNLFKTKAEVKELFASYLGFTGANIPVPTLKQMNEVLSDNHGLTIMLIERNIVFEKNGVRKSLKPWADNVIVFLQSLQVGDLAWGRLAEAKRPVKQVDYQEVDDFILLSKYATNDPFREYTSSQALVVPVINDVNSIYILDTNEAQSTSGQTEEDATLTIYGDSTVTVANLVNALNHEDVKSKPAANLDMTDVQLITLVNKLSNAKETALKAILEIPTVDAGANTTADSATKALVGTATAAEGKTIASIQWSQVSGPNTAGFSAPTALSTNATGLETGVYVFKLTVTDSAGTVASDTITITATVN